MSIVTVPVPNIGLYPTLAKIAGWQFGNRGPAASAGWGDAAVIVPWSMYHMTGNTSILRQQYTSMKRWCDYIIRTAETQRGKNRKVPKEVDRYLWNTGFHFGEWLIPSLAKDGYKHIVIHPRPDESLTWAKRGYKSVHGGIVCNWEREGGAFRMEVTIPCNTTATAPLLLTWAERNHPLPFQVLSSALGGHHQ